jgi:hypothetical protein
MIGYAEISDSAFKLILVLLLAGFAIAFAWGVWAALRGK